MSASFEQREFPMTDANFSAIRKVAYEFTGINLSEHKKEMIYSRLSRRLRVLRLHCFDQYIQLLKQDDPREHSEFINAITTNLTGFFREPHHFDYLKKQVLPDLRKANAKSKRLRIWSAGCSTGEEPYTLAICLKEAGFPSDWDIKILATDLDSNVVAHGKQGIYANDKLEALTETQRQRYFSTVDARQSQVKPELQQLIAFKRLNLLENWPMKQKFDVIFCRNVVIYFDKDTQKGLFDKYANILIDKGHLFIGHSESLNNVTTRFDSLGKTMYRKIS